MAGGNIRYGSFQGEDKSELTVSIGHGNWWKAAEEEEAAGLDGVAAKWGKGKGWQLYCVRDLIAACAASAAEGASIYITFS